MKRRVVITGLGVVSPLGHDVNTFYQNLIKGKIGIDKITKFDSSDFEVKLAGEVKDFDPLIHLEKRFLKRVDDFTIYGSYAAVAAHKDAGLDQFAFDPNRYGCIVSSAAGGLKTEEDQLMENFTKKSYRNTKPLLIPKILANMLSGNVSILLNAKGYSNCAVTACAAGTHSIGDAYRLIKHNYLDLCVAGGADSTIKEMPVAGFAALRALSRATDPKRASIPFDKERQGFVMAEGAGVLILEELQHAIKRKAKIYAEVVGYGATSDAGHITAPSLDGPKRAMLEAIKDAQIKPSDITYLNAHGTSTPINDKNETEAIKAVFQEHTSNLYVSSTKSLIGHALGAAGAIEAVFVAKSLNTGEVHGTNTNGDGEGCDLNYLQSGSKKINHQFAMSNSFGFGGHNGVLIFKKWEGV